MNDFLNEMIEKVVADLSKKKQDIILIRIKKIAGVNDFSFEEEAKRTFKRITVIHSDNGNHEAYYWNDGTTKGKLLVEFFRDEKMDLAFTGDEPMGKITFGLRYK